MSEYAAHEFGALQGVGMASGWCLIADALDLRHRFPRIWTQVQAGQVRAWQARKVAEQTRHLSPDAADDIDEALAGYLGMLPWPRMLKILTAAIIAADPALAREREERARTERTVYATKSEHGLKVIVARATSGEVNLFMATINRLADISEPAATTARSRSAGPKQSASSLNPAGRCNSFSTTAPTPPANPNPPKTTTRTSKSPTAIIAAMRTRQLLRHRLLMMWMRGQPTSPGWT